MFVGNNVDEVAVFFKKLWHDDNLEAHANGDHTD
jgi:hypothetical protein